MLTRRQILTYGDKEIQRGAPTGTLNLYVRQGLFCTAALPAHVNTAFGGKGFNVVKQLAKQKRRCDASPLLFWWANRDSNPGPTGYEPVALTN